MLKRGFLLLCALVVVSASMPSIAQTDGGRGDCRSLPGRWAWFTNVIVYFYPDGTAKAPAFNLSGGWVCADGKVAIAWPNNYRDSLTISPDGKNLSGSNQDGTHVSAERIGDL